MRGAQKGIMKEKVFDAIVDYIKEHQYPPSMRDLCELTCLKSTSSVYRYVQILMDEGKIESDHEFGTPRAIRVVGYEYRKLEE